MANIKLKLTALTPVHIGSGEVYEPTNFIMDANVLYEFRDEDFFMALPQIKQEAFMNMIKDNQSDSFVKVHKFVKDNKEIAIKVASVMVNVTSGLQKDYDRLLGKIRQQEGRRGDNSRVFNRFEIQKIQRKQVKTESGGYSNTGYIVGSSLKGSISTAYQEFIFKQDGKKVVEEKFQAKGREISNNIFKDFKVSDSRVKKIGTKLGFALNKERFEYDRHNPQANLKLSTYIEVINPSSEFMVDINYGTLDIEEILESCTSHYMPIFKSMFANKTDGKNEYINEYLPASFYDKYRHFQLKPNQYLLRVGKHSGARAVTIDGLRDIKSKISGGGKRRKPNKFEYRKDETTTWLFGENDKLNSNLLPFGWLICEVVQEEHQDTFEAIDELHKIKDRRVQEFREGEDKREKAKEAEEKKEQEAKAKREAELASMTPIQRVVDSYDDIAKLINDMKSGNIENFETIKVELATEVKKILQQTPKTWDKAKKKALERKGYIEGLLR